MRTVLIALTVVFFGVSTGASPAFTPLIERTRRQFPPPNVPLEIATEWRRQLWDAHKLIRAKEYRSAISILDSWRDHCARYGPNNLAASTLVQLGTAELAIFEHARALPDLLAARHVNLRIGDWAGVASSSFTLSNLYVTVGAAPEAEQAADLALQSLARSQNRPLLANLLLHQARLLARRGDLDRAIPLFHQSITTAGALRDRQLEATAWSGLGIALQRARRWDEAEQALTKGIDLWNALNRAEVAGFYASLAEVKLSRDDRAGARSLIDRAFRSFSPKHTILPEWHLTFVRGLVFEAEAQPLAALHDLRRAVRQVEDSQRHLLPADALRVSAVVGTNQVYSAYLRVALDVYLATPPAQRDPRLLAETLVAAETQRALALRVARAANRVALPRSPNYERTLEALASFYADAYRDGAQASRLQRQQLNLRLTEIEAETGSRTAPDPVPASDPAALISVLKDIPPSEAILRFHLDEHRSYLWVLAGGGIQLLVLPPRQRIRGQVNGFLTAVERHSPELAPSGHSLWSTLFSALPESVRSLKHWRIIPDDVLFRLPFAALVENISIDRPRFLIESRAVSLLPSVWPSPPLELRNKAKSFLGVADPVYNTADDRFEAPTRSLLSFFEPRPHGTPLSLSRLLGSHREVDSAVQLVRQADPAASVTVLEGRQANWKRIRHALDEKPSIVHMAVHVLPTPGASEESLIALSLDPQGRAELVGPEAIGSRFIPASLVVLSGCRSASGVIRDGEGLMGLTRAWLGAGAGSVLATYWPTLDADPTIQKFYRYWSSHNEVSSVPLALREAQIEMLKSDGWRLEPRVWAAYLVTIPLRAGDRL